MRRSKQILKDLDTVRFYSRNDDESDGFNDGVFDSSKSKQPNDKSVYGLDNPYIDYLRDKVRDSKQNKGR